MQTSSRRSLPNIRIFEDGRTPPPVQRRFPDRRHLTNTKTSRSITPTARWRQQTLTQITPSLSHLSSGFGSFDGNDELEFDDLEDTMPPKKRHRRTSNLPVQQQTITQMDPFRLQRYSDQDLLPSDTERSASPSPRKKRKSLSTTPVARTVQTRSAKKKAAEADIQNRLEVLPTENKEQVLDPEWLHASPVPESQSVTMPPPQTPMTIRRKVIPSSQSPAETPPSTYKKSRTMPVTPFKERSVNTPSKSRATSRRKFVQWAPTLEVADSTEFENEDSQSSFPVLVQRRPSSISVTKSAPQPEIVQENLLPMALSSLPPADNSNINITLRSDPQEPSVRTVERKETIPDSDDDAGDPASQSSDRAINDGTSWSSTVPGSVKDAINVTATEPLEIQEQGPVIPTLLSCDSDDLDNESIETVPTQLLSQPTRHISRRQAPTRSLRRAHDPNDILGSEEGTTDSPHENLSFNSPRRPLGYPILETESQFDNAWRDYNSPLGNGNALETNGEDIVAGIDAHEPSLPLANHIAGTYSSTDLHSLPLIPPSQATTADITQASLQHDQRLHQPSARNIGLQVASSPPQQRPAPPFSSPFQTRKGPVADTYMGYQGWNGVPMTESQLLPNSLLNDSQGLPMMADVEEGLELETEEY
ncbi:MAG: hypothetical protein Q9172_006976 [Xanthocarpia lactea]